MSTASKVLKSLNGPAGCPRYQFLFVLLFSIAFCHFSFAETREELAQKAAEKWLSLTDTEKYAESWDEAAVYFQKAISKEDCEKTMKGGRTPLGAVKSRTLTSAEYANSLPGAPDGDYVVIRYETSFDKKKTAVETITPMLEKDRGWRVAGYHIQ
jgi:hypothetical protein